MIGLLIVWLSADNSMMASYRMIWPYSRYFHIFVVRISGYRKKWNAYVISGSSCSACKIFVTFPFSKACKWPNLRSTWDIDTNMCKKY